ncbi:MAG: N-acetylglucosaminyldiphosphoundecaprenol N-acetyl-beta-D-mannosaminyltransferase [Actinomycetota bacterium]|jgi:N-acetylglucosaminyldiphosphoundecaprenol N-acetyl-beta-D-mannosaminyltransferase|nr:N-acetylglucosaminyldiphosphoundecaprenol N-acetyl-beta-D-mannosaminyltransferase [Actinomycetota bacterium]
MAERSSTDTYSDPMTAPDVVLSGLRISTAGMAETKLAIETWVASSQRPPAQIATVNLDFLALGERNPTFKTVLHKSALVLADGMGVVWLSKLAGCPIPERVAGADLVTWLVDGGIQDARLFLLGSTPETIDRIQARAARAGGNIVGSATPLRGVFESDLQSARIVDKINRSGANILLLALGPPLQEIWIERWLRRLEVEVAIGVGASLDFAAGTRPRAPEAWQRLGVEWLYRLLREPRRLWKRYIRRDIPFFVSEGWRSMVARRTLASGAAPQAVFPISPASGERDDLSVEADGQDGSRLAGSNDPSLTIDLSERSNVRASAETH